MLLFKLYDCISLLTTDNSLHHWLVNFAGHRTPVKKKEKESWQKLSKHFISESFKISDAGGWGLEKKTDFGVFYSKNIPNIGKVLKFEGVINSSVDNIKHKLYDEADKSPGWNNTLQTVKVIKKIDESLMITQSITRRYHALSVREFVHLQSWAHINNYVVVTCISINYPGVPESSHAIRGEHKLFAYIMHPVQNDPSKTHFVWLMNVNLKGWLPQTIVEQTLCMGMSDHVKNLRLSFEK